MSGEAEAGGRIELSERLQTRFRPLTPSMCALTISWVMTFLLLAGTAFADAPSVTHLFPAGFQRGSTTTITCNGKFEWPLQVWASTGEVKLQEDKGKFTVSVPDNISTDRIWLRFYNEDGATSPMPLLLGNLPETTESEPNDSPSNAQKLSDFAKPPNDARVTINGALQKKGDVDAFAVNLKASQTLVAALEGNTHFGSPLDAILQVVSPDGLVLDENHDDVGLDPRLAFTCKNSGPHIVRVMAFPAKPNQTIAFAGGDDYVYRLMLTTGPYIARTIPSAVSVQNFGVLSPATVNVVGWNLAGKVTLPIRRLLGENNVGLVSAPSWAASARVALQKHPVLRLNSGGATLQVPCSVDGCLVAEQKSEAFVVNLKKDEQIEFLVDALQLDSHLVPQLQIHDPNQKSVYATPESGAAKDIRHTFKPKLDGEYRVMIQDRYGNSGDRYFYRLSLQRPQRGFELSLDVDSIVVSNGEPAELPVNIVRHNVGRDSVGEIRVSIEDLPEGVTCESLISPSEGDTPKKVTLKLTSERSEKYAGSIRVIGEEIAGGFRRTAFTPDRFRSRFDSLWLTVNPNAANEGTTDEDEQEE